MEMPRTRRDVSASSDSRNHGDTGSAENDMKVANAERGKNAKAQRTTPKSPHLRTSARGQQTRTRIVKSVEELQLEEIERKRQEIRVQRRIAEKRMQMSLQGTLVRCSEGKVDAARRQLTLPKTPSFATDARAARKTAAAVRTNEVGKASSCGSKLRNGSITESYSEARNASSPVVPRLTVARSPRLSYRLKEARSSVVPTQEEQFLLQRKAFKARPMPYFASASKEAAVKPKTSDTFSSNAGRDMKVTTHSDRSVQTSYRMRDVRAEAPSHHIVSAIGSSTSSGASGPRKSAEYSRHAVPHTRPQRAYSETPQVLRERARATVSISSRLESRLSTIYTPTNVSLSYEEGSTPWFEADVAAQDEL